MFRQLSNTGIPALLVLGLSLIISAWLAPAGGSLDNPVIGLLGLSSLSLAGLLAMAPRRFAEAKVAVENSREE